MWGIDPQKSSNMLSESIAHPTLHEPLLTPLGIHHKRNCCRICDSQNLHLFLSLGAMPLANAFLETPANFRDERSYPLDVYFCANCTLVQLVDVIDPTVLFSQYNYITGTSDTIAAHHVKYARAMVERLELKPSDLVIEIASNDGSLLKNFRPYGVRTLGVEPAQNIAKIANAAGIETANQFFNAALALQLASVYGRAQCIIANNVLAHVDDPKDFLLGCKQLLAPEGIISIEVPYIYNLIEQLEYDTIYHEHLSYFSVQSLMLLCQEVGLGIMGVEYIPIHGGSIRVLMGYRARYPTHSTSVLDLVKSEKALGLDQFWRYSAFGDDVLAHRHNLLSALHELKTSQKSIVGYGAPAKGNTLLNFCKIGTDLLPYTVDKSILKVGRYTPGMHIPVRSISDLIEDQPDYVLVLAWNFVEEIMRQQELYRQRGGKFLVPFPAPHIL